MGITVEGLSPFWGAMVFIMSPESALNVCVPSQFIRWSTIPKRKWKCQTLSRVWFFATPWTLAHQGSSTHGILQARILEWAATSFSRGSTWPRDRTQVSRIAGRCFNLCATREALGTCVIFNLGRFIKNLTSFPNNKSLVILSDQIHPSEVPLLAKYCSFLYFDCSNLALQGSFWSYLIWFVSIYSHINRCNQ